MEWRIPNFLNPNSSLFSTYSLDLAELAAANLASTKKKRSFIHAAYSICTKSSGEGVTFAWIVAANRLDGVESA